jgi:hypothetical protein
MPWSAPPDEGGMRAEAAEMAIDDNDHGRAPLPMS